jgi:phosphopantetheinyl transferase
MQNIVMALIDDKWITELFDASVCDWTPPFFADRVLYLPISSNPEVTKRCATVLSDSELARADDFLTEKDRAGFIQRRAFRRYCGAVASGSRSDLSQIIFEETENGRPWIASRPDVSFSFSSCSRGFLGAWSSTHGLGLDVADHSMEVEAAELAGMYFTESESRAVGKGSVAGRRTFFQLWCLKEAALKSIGEGIPFGIDAFGFEINGNPHITRAPKQHGGPDRFSAHLFEQPHVCAALVACTID